MRTDCHVVANRKNLQFGMKSMLEFTTICAVLFAFSASIGAITSICLVLMAAALATRQGLPAVLCLGAAFLLGDYFHAASELGVLRHTLLCLLSATLCGWFRLRRAWREHGRVIREFNATRSTG